ncbi:MAG: ABC transporter permease subunit, partial [Nitriliruptorales bacterium]|nr:ABC transporter permease subunit [Nitriliruptorales bacterium]
PHAPVVQGAKRPITAALGRGLFLVAPFALLLLVWWSVKELFAFPDRVLVAPSQVARATADLLWLGMLSDAAGASIGRLSVAAVIALGVAVPIGLALGMSAPVSRSVEPFLRFLQNISGIAWLPLGIVWYGFSDRTILAVVLYTFFIPVLFNTMIGVQTVPRRFEHACRTLGAGTGQIVRDVYIPGALPGILIGMSLGIGYGWRALIAGEMLVGEGGLGEIIFSARQLGQVDLIMAGMIIIGFLYLVFDRLIVEGINQLTVDRWGSRR